MDLSQIEAFVQVAQQLSFSRAAQALQLTQPSVTARIQSLERELGEELFERGGRGVRLTDAGEAFLPHALKILQVVKEGRDAVEEVRSLGLGHLRLGSALTISTYVLPKILHAFRRRFPGINVSVRTGRSEQVLGMVLSDEVQAGLVRSLQHPEVETVPLYEDEIVLAVPRDHSFAQRGEARLEEVATQPLILFDRGSSYFGLIHSYFRQAGMVPHVAMELDSLEATKRMVEEGLGIAMVPRVTIERELELGVLVEVPIVDAAPLSRTIALIYRRNRRRPRPVLAFLEVLGEIYRFQPASA
ncbi:HTH-type transcriptional regulator CynR [bacterium HR25]|jgi:DNA-binding transcriptional LysR family regulator|nr:HTH-type transcriptional regulator CynR [bacterium HR25]